MKFAGLATSKLLAGTIILSSLSTLKIKVKQILRSLKMKTLPPLSLSISGYWWDSNGMNEYCDGWPDTDRVGARVNGRYLLNGYQDRRYYTNRAFKYLGL